MNREKRIFALYNYGKTRMGPRSINNRGIEWAARGSEGIERDINFAECYSE